MEETKMGRGDEKMKNDHESENEIDGNREWNKRKHRIKLMERENEIRDKKKKNYHESEKKIEVNREWNKRKHRMKLMETENEIRGNTE